MTDPNLDFKSLQAAVDRVRHVGGQPDDLSRAEYEDIGDKPRLNPLRKRVPAFRWRLIPAVFCAFQATVCLRWLIVYDIACNVTYAGHRPAAIFVAVPATVACCVFLVQKLRPVPTGRRGKHRSPPLSVRLCAISLRLHRSPARSELADCRRFSHRCRSNAGVHRSAMLRRLALGKT